MRNLKRTLSVVLASVMLLGMMVVGASAASFTDADEIVNTEAVEITAGLGLFAGTDGKFLPKDNVTRAQMATIIVKMLYGSEINADQYKGIDKFSDTASFEGGWAEGYINLCANLGVVAGYGDGTYQPGKQVTTAEAVTMIINALDVDAGEGTWPLTVMAKAEEMKLFEELSPKPGTNEALIRDQLAAIVLAGLEYSPKGNNGYKVRINGKDVTFEKYSDALLAASSIGATAEAIEEIVGEDSLANKTFEMKTAKGFVTENKSTNSEATWTTVSDVDYNIESGLDMIGHLVTVYYKDEYKSEKEPGTAYCLVDESKAVVVEKALVANNNTDNKTFKSLFGTKRITVYDPIVFFDPEYERTEIDAADVDWFDFTNKAADAGTYIIDEDNNLVAYIAKSNVYATEISKVTTTAGKESISMKLGGTLLALNNNEDEDIVNEYEGVEKGDIVTAVKAGNTWTLTKAAIVEGKITRTYTNKDGDKIVTVDGKDYKLFTGINDLNNNLTLPNDLDVTYKLYVTADNEVIDYVASEGQADLSNIVYVVNVFMTNADDDYGNNTYKISAQVVDMEGKTATYLLASYKTEGGAIVPTETSGDKTSALPAGTMGKTFEAGHLNGNTETGFYTFKKSENSKLANLGIMVPTAVAYEYDKNESPIYQAETKDMDGQKIDKKTVSIRTTDGTAYLADTTKFIIYDGTGASLTATISTGKLYHTFEEEAGVILSQNSDGNKVIEAVLINKDPDEVSNGEFYYADGHSYDFTTGDGEQHNLYNQKGEKVAVVLDVKGVAKGFYKYSVDADGKVTLNDPEAADYAKVDQVFETVYNNLIVAGEIENYDISGAKVIDVRDEDDIDASDYANYAIDDIADLVSLMNQDDAPEILIDMYVDPQAETVSLIFITSIEEAST